MFSGQAQTGNYQYRVNVIASSDLIKYTLFLSGLHAGQPLKGTSRAEGGYAKNIRLFLDTPELAIWYHRECRDPLSIVIS
jgi:hypothetical protein